MSKLNVLVTFSELLVTHCLKAKRSYKLAELGETSKNKLISSKSQKVIHKAF